MIKNVITVLIVGGLLVAGLVFGLNLSKEKPTLPGAASGSDVSFRMFFRDNINVGGNDFATSSVGAATFTAALINNARVIEHTAASAVTLTLPTNAALSGAGFLPNVGDTQVVFIHATTTAITLAGNTGVTISTASSTKSIAAGQIGRLECTRLGALEARGIWCLLIAD